MLTMLEQFPPVNEEQIAALEGRPGRRLPDQYRQFLLRFYGGRLKERVVDISGPGDSDEVRYFYGIDAEEEWGDLLRTHEIFRDRIPDHLLPIAEDDLGNQICISLSPPDNGKIYFWDHELEFTPGRAITLLADSFDEFLDRLRGDG